jgi:phosphoglycolate phosphatase
MKYKLIIFDFDGTLADSFQWFARAINLAAAKFKIRQVAPNEFEMLRGLNAKAILKHLHVPFWKIPRLGNYMRTLMNQEIGQIHLFPGIEKMLQVLKKQGAVLGLVSSNSWENIQQVLGEENARLFAFPQCGVSIYGKSAQLRKILRASAIAPLSTIYIGDEIRDLEAARAVKINFGAVAWGYTHFEALQAAGPEKLFCHVNELLDLN